jgi:hypothetical protein
LIFNGTYEEENRAADEDLPGLRAPLCLAAQMGAGLGSGHLLLGPLSRHGKGRICKEDLKQLCLNW